MQNRLWERLRAWLMLFVLLIISLSFLIAENEPFYRSIRSASLEASSWVEARFAWAGHFLTALEANDQLRQENIHLASQLAQARQARLENEELRRLLQFQDTTDLQLVPARIVSKDITLQENMLTIDVGSSDSVEVGMAVVDANGIVGKVVLTSPNYSRVMPYLNTSFRVPGQILPIDANGIVTWRGSDRHQLYMQHVPKTSPVLRGQLVVTSSSSSTFPDGYPIGFVDSVSARVGQNEQNVFMTPAAPLSAIEHVFVILEDFSEEQQSLEGRSVTATYEMEAP